MLISEAFDLYKQSEVVAAGLSPKTAESYTYASKLASSYFGNIEVGSLRLEDIWHYYDHLLGWQKPDTARGNIICLRADIRLLKRRGEQVIDPDDIKVPKREKRIITYLTKTEVDALIEIVATRRRGYAEVNRLRNIAIVKLLYSTGVRISELCRLNRNSIRDRQFTVIGKSLEPRPCFITKDVEESIAQYLELRHDHEMALFISNQNGKRIKPGNVRRIFQRICKQSDFNGVHPHTMRHSFATYMLEKDVDLIYISQMMGHKSLDTTRMYTHFTNPKLKRIYDNATRPMGGQNA